MPERILETERLVLETLERRHAHLLFDVLSDSAIYEYIPQDPPKTIEKLAERYAQLEVGHSTSRDEVWLNYALRKRESGTYVGTVQATVAGTRAHIAYELGPLYWGQGLASEAVRALIEHLRSAFGVDVIRAETDTRNERSGALLERLGFMLVERRENADFFKGTASHEFVYELRRL